MAITILNYLRHSVHLAVGGQLQLTLTKKSNVILCWLFIQISGYREEKHKTQKHKTQKPTATSTKKTTNKLYFWNPLNLNALLQKVFSDRFLFWKEWGQCRLNPRKQSRRNCLFMAVRGKEMTQLRQIRVHLETLIPRAQWVCRQKSIRAAALAEISTLTNT